MTTVASEPGEQDPAARDRLPAPPRPDGPGWPPATWALHETLAVAMMPFGVSLVASIAVFVVGAEGGPAIFAVTLVQQIALGLGTWAWVRSHTGTANGLGLATDRRGGDIGVGVGAGLGAIVASAIVLVITQELTGIRRIEDPFRSAGEAWVIPIAIMAVILAPVCEEIAFRGFLFGGLRRRFGFLPAAAASAALFAVIHGDLVRIPALFVSGVILAGVYEARRSLVAPIAAHGAVNLLSALVTVLGRS